MSGTMMVEWEAIFRECPEGKRPLLVERVKNRIASELVEKLAALLLGGKERPEELKSGGEYDKIQ